MNRPFKRLMSGVMLLAAMAALAMMATTSVFAFHQGGTQSSASNPGPLNTFGTAGQSSVTPGSIASYTANYSYTSPSLPGTFAFVSPAAGSPNQTNGFATGSVPSSQNTTIGTMYQQWRHSAMSDRWFYLYAGNRNLYTAAAANAASNANPTFAYYYYTRDRGQTEFFSNQVGTGAVSVAGAAGTGFVTAQAGVTPIVYIDTNATLPMATIVNMAAVVPGCNATASGQRCAASFSAAARWGLAQEAWPTGASVLFSQAVESVPMATGPTATAGQPVAPNTAGAITFYDGWQQNATTTLTNTAPAQAATGVTNVGTTAAPATRTTGQVYTMVQTVTDANSDLQSGQLVFVYTSGAQVGQWFRVGYVNGDNNDNTINVTTGSCFYDSSFESTRTTSVNALTGTCNALTGTYVTNYQASATGSAASETVTHNLQFNVLGATSVYGRAEDFHGSSSGNVLVGAVTVS